MKRKLTAVLLVAATLLGCSSVGVQYRQYTGDIKSVLVSANVLELETLLRTDLEGSEYNATAATPALEALALAPESIESDSSLRLLKRAGYDGLLVVTARLGGDQRPSSAVVTLINTSNGKKTLAATWKGTGDDYTSYGYEMSPEYRQLLLDGRQTMAQASVAIASRVVKEIPKTWW